MKKILILCAFLGIVSCGSNSNDPDQDFSNIFQGNIALTTMTEVLEFSQNNYTEVTGELNISEAANTSDPITSLSSLSSLQRTLSISISNTSVLTTLDGLQNIESTENVGISYNSEVTDISAFDGVFALGFSIVENPKLRNIDNFKVATEDMYYIWVLNNPLVENLECFSNVTNLQRSLRLFGNHSLTNLSGIDKIETVGTPDFLGQAICQINENNALLSLEGLNVREFLGDVEILYNPVLSNIDNLSTATSITLGNLSIGDTAISNINGLQNLTSIEGDITIFQNTNLNDFCGLKNLFSVGGQSNGFLYVFGNLTNPNEQDILNNTSCN